MKIKNPTLTKVKIPYVVIFSCLIVVFILTFITCDAAGGGGGNSSMENGTNNGDNKTNDDDDNNKTTYYYTITFNSNGGSYVEPKTAIEYEEISKPADPVKEGYIFDNWFFDNGKFKEWVQFPYIGSYDTTLYARWLPEPEIGDKQSPIGEPGNTFKVITDNMFITNNSATAEIVNFEDGVTSIKITAGLRPGTGPFNVVPNPLYTFLALLPLPKEVLDTEGDVFRGGKVWINLKVRMTTEGIQEVTPEGEHNFVKYNAEVGDVYENSYNDLKREVTAIEDNFPWNGMEIKVIRVKETGSAIMSPLTFTHTEYIFNDKYGLVGCDFKFNNNIGSVNLFPIVSEATNY
jgi:hypothetical protein